MTMESEVIMTECPKCGDERASSGNTSQARRVWVTIDNVEISFPAGSSIKIDVHRVTSCPESECWYGVRPRWARADEDANHVVISEWERCKRHCHHGLIVLSPGQGIRMPEIACTQTLAELTTKERD